MEVHPHILTLSAQELLKMEAADQQMVMQAIKDSAHWDGALCESNTARLKQIIAEIGWPTISKVGQEASLSAWVLVQHSRNDIAFMKDCLSLMKQAEEGEVPPFNIALLEDSILVVEGRPQIYGTQFGGPEDDFRPYPIIDEANVDARRASMGLDTFAENQAAILKMYAPNPEG
jgi:hypothetical protein